MDNSNTKGTEKIRVPPTLLNRKVLEKGEKVYFRGCIGTGNGKLHRIYTD